MNYKFDIGANLHKLVGLTKENNYLVLEIKQGEEDAKYTIETAEKENKQADERLKEIAASLKGLEEFNNGAISLGKSYIGIVEDNKIPFDIASITKSCKDASEKLTGEKETLEQQVADNKQKLESAHNVVEETPIKLSTQESNRKDLLALIESALAGGKDLTKSRIDTVLSKLGVFTEDEIQELYAPIIFPEQGLESAYKNFDARGKSAGEVVKEALSAGAKQVPKKPLKEEKTVKESSSKPKEEKSKKTNTTNNALDLDDILGKAHGTTKTVKKVVKSEPKKKNIEPKEEKVKPIEFKTVEDEKDKEDNKTPEVSSLKNDRSFICEKLGLEEEDIDLVPKAANITKAQLTMMTKALEDNGIDPQSVSLSTYVNGVDVLIDNIKIIRNYYNIDDMDILKNPYLSAVPTDRVANDLELLAQCQLSLTNQVTGKNALTVLSKETNKLMNGINLTGSVDMDWFIVNPENMAKTVGSSVAKIYYCQENGIAYQDNNMSLIANDTEFKELYGDVSTSIIPSAKQCNEALLENIDDINTVATLSDFWKNGSYLAQVELSSSQMDKFMDIYSKIGSLSQTNDNYSFVIDGKRFCAFNVQKNISCLVASNSTATDEDIILSSLFYRAHKSPSDIKDIKGLFDPNRLRSVA